MKKIMIISGLLLSLMPGAAFASTTVTVDENNSGSSTVTIDQSQPVVVTQPVAVVQQPVAVVQPLVLHATPVVIAKEVNPREFEGEIIKVDYPGSQIIVHDTWGRDRRVDVKQGMINNYKVNDYVEVTLMADMKEAKMIRTIRDNSRYDAVVVGIDPNTGQLIIRDTNQMDRTVVVAAPLVTEFKTGDRVRIYTVADDGEVRFIRIA